MGMELAKDRLLDAIGDDPAAARAFSTGLERFEAFLLREMPCNPRALDAAMSLTAALAQAIEPDSRPRLVV